MGEILSLEVCILFTTYRLCFFFFFQAEDGIRDLTVTGVQTCALPILGLLEREEPYRHRVGVCYRCGTVVEPLVSRQWFVKIEPLARPALAAVRDGRTRFIPKQWENTYFAWMENIRDWCISRQLWWGHRIPVWTCEACGGTVVAREDPTECPACRGAALVQEADVLDTWFSSALWPFSTLGWPERTGTSRGTTPPACSSPASTSSSSGWPA